MEVRFLMECEGVCENERGMGFRESDLVAGNLIVFIVEYVY